MRSLRPLFLLSLCLLSAVNLAFGAEGVAADPAQCGPFPKLYKEIVWNWMQKNLVDANSAKIQWDAEPKAMDLGKGDQHIYGWLVDFKVNSRNKFGLYTGKQTHSAFLRDGQVLKTFGFGY